MEQKCYLFAYIIKGYPYNCSDVCCDVFPNFNPCDTAVSNAARMQSDGMKSSHTGCLVPLHTAPQMRRSKYRIPHEARSNPVLLKGYACL